MAPKFFIPARNTRHRVACFALYRALVRSGRRIPLPNDLLASGTAHPVALAIRRQFQRNRGDVSPRLVYSALSAGYKFLSIFEQARSEGSKRWDEIVSFLRKMKEEADAERAQNAAIEASKPPPEPPRERRPFLTRISPTPENPDAPPEYVSTFRPLPLSALRGRRHVPRIAATATGSIPFLRVSKPQSDGLNRVLRWKLDQWRKREDRAQRLNEEDMPLAKQEDGWERVVMEQARREGKTLDIRGLYRHFVWESMDELMKTFERERVDNIARARAMVKIVEEETELARQEEHERIAMKDQHG